MKERKDKKTHIMKCRLYVQFTSSLQTTKAWKPSYKESFFTLHTCKSIILWMYESAEYMAVFLSPSCLWAWWISIQNVFVIYRASSYLQLAQQWWQEHNIWYMCIIIGQEVRESMRLHLTPRCKPDYEGCQGAKSNKSLNFESQRDW